MTPTSTTYGTTSNLRVLAVALILALAPIQAAAQGSDPDAADDGVNLGPLGLSTRIGWQTGYEDNVFRSAERPVSDIVSTLSAGTEVRTQLRRVGLSGRGAADWVHFDKLVGERGANMATALRLDFLFNRVVPYISSSYGSTRKRLNPEVDTRPRIGQSTVAVGSVFRISGKTALDISASRSIQAYDRNAAADGVSLSAALNRASDTFALSFLQQVTPVTRLTVTGETYQDRFDVSSGRNARNIRLTTGFDSDGRIKGSARVGVRILKSHDPNVPESRGFFLALSTSATVLDRVQIGIDAQRDVEPSYRPNVAYYQSFSYGASFNYAVLRALRLSASVGRRLADYRASGGAVTSAADQEGVERQTIYGSAIRYRLGESVGIDFSGGYGGRTSNFASHRFNGASFGAGISYAF